MEELLNQTFMLRVVIIQLVIMAICIIALFSARSVERLFMKRIERDRLHLKLMLNRSIGNEQTIDLAEVPKTFHHISNLLPLLETYDHNFTDYVWIKNKELLIQAYLIGYLPKYLKSHLWQKRQEALRVIALWPEHLLHHLEIVPFLNDKVYLVRVAAAASLVKSHQPSLIALVVTRMTLETPLARYPFRDLLINGGKKVFDVLEEIATCSNAHEDVAVCLDVLSTRTDHNLIKLAEQHVKSPDVACRLYATKILENIGGPEAVHLITERLKDMDPTIRAAAAAALGRMIAYKSVSDLAPLLNDPDWLTRLQAAIALKAMVPEGRDILFKQDPGISSEAYEVAQYVLALP